MLESMVRIKDGAAEAPLLNLVIREDLTWGNITLLLAFAKFLRYMLKSTKRQRVAPDHQTSDDVEYRPGNS